jgi:HSP20 family protein
MWFHFSDLDRTFAALDTLGRGLQRGHRRHDAEPARMNAEDTGDAWVVRAELPGIPVEAVELTLAGQVLKLQANRRDSYGDDVTVHRAERQAVRLTRSITLPHKIDAERVSARAKDGILEVTLPKAVEARPRTIAVNAA